jgi:CRP-like cAMP-binding protein
MIRPTVLKLEAGSLVFLEGEASDKMYVIHTGKIQLKKRYGNKFVSTEVVEEGGLVGEMAFLSGLPYDNAAWTLENCQLLVVSRNLMDSMKNSLPNWLNAIFRILVNRMHDANKRKHYELLARAYPALLRQVRVLQRLKKSDTLRIEELVASLACQNDVSQSEILLLCKLTQKLGYGVLVQEEGQISLKTPVPAILNAHYEYLYSRHKKVHTPWESLTRQCVQFLEKLVAYYQKTGTKKGGRIYLPAFSITDFFEEDVGEIELSRFVDILKKRDILGEDNSLDLSGQIYLHIEKASVALLFHRHLKQWENLNIPQMIRQATSIPISPPQAEEA